MEVDTKEYDDEISSVLAQVPDFAVGGAEWQWLTGGGAHKNFLATSGDRASKCVVKLWNRELEQIGLIPPSPVVMENTRMAGEFGIGAKVLAVVQEPLSLVLEYIPGSELEGNSDEDIVKIASAARNLHDSKIKFYRDFNPFAESRVMLAAAYQRQVPFPEGFESTRSTLEQIESVLDLRPNQFVPCHNDLYSPNIICTSDGQLRLIDYDLSGNGDRCYDLGFISTYSKYNLDQTGKLVESYFGQTDRKLLARVHLFAIAADYCTLALWLAVQAVADTNDDYDYAGYMQASWEGMCTKIDDQEFGGRLELCK